MVTLIEEANEEIYLFSFYNPNVCIYVFDYVYINVPDLCQRAKMPK